MSVVFSKFLVNFKEKLKPENEWVFIHIWKTYVSGSFSILFSCKVGSVYLYINNRE